MRNLAFLLALFTTSPLLAQHPEDAKAIKSMCGCYEVTFQFAETFSPDTAYQFHDKHRSSGLEWVQLVEDTKGKIVLQHLLIANDTTIIKHWRQDWLYENTDLYVYSKDNHWKFTRLPKASVRGQWTQKVFQVDDGPRYEATATWIHADGRHYWEGSAPSPLPRREFTHRSDYNVLKRRNRHEITAWGWLHEQDNDKVQVGEASAETLLAREKGWDTYKRVPDSRCTLAQTWWKENSHFWAEVRKEWSGIYGRNKDLMLEKTVDSKPLFMYLFALKPEETPQIQPVLQKFVK